MAVHGSGFVYPPNIIHWLYYAQMARQTGATVIVPGYPLIPDGGTAANTIPPMADFIADQVETYGAGNVSVYGDSAGGTLAMLAVQKIVRDCGGDADCLESRVPSRMVLVSPGLSGPEFYTDPNVVLVDDPVSPIPNPNDYKPWQGNSPEELWNPMAGSTTEASTDGDLHRYPRDRCAPGALLFAEKVVNENPGADFTVVIGMGPDPRLGAGRRHPDQLTDRQVPRRCLLPWHRRRRDRRRLAERPRWPLSCSRLISKAMSMSWSSWPPMSLRCPARCSS